LTTYVPIDNLDGQIILRLIPKLIMEIKEASKASVRGRQQNWKIIEKLEETIESAIRRLPVPTNENVMEFNTLVKYWKMFRLTLLECSSD